MLLLALGAIACCTCVSAPCAPSGAVASNAVKALVIVYVASLVQEALDNPFRTVRIDVPDAISVFRKQREAKPRDDWLTRKLTGRPAARPVSLSGVPPACAARIRGACGQLMPSKEACVNCLAENDVTEACGPNPEDYCG